MSTFDSTWKIQGCRLLVNNLSEVSEALFMGFSDRRTMPNLPYGSLAQPGYSSNSSGPKTEMENAHVEIPISNKLFHALGSSDGLLRELKYGNFIGRGRVAKGRYPSLT
jgi:hypothetical protein